MSNTGFQVAEYQPYRDMGAVLDVCRFPLSAPTPGILFEAIELQAQRHDALLRQHNGGEIPPGLPRVSVDNDAGPPVPERIRFDQFLGKGFDLARDRVQLFHYSSGGRSTTHATRAGLAGALLDPPYSLRTTIRAPLGSPELAVEEPEWMRRLLHRFFAEVLHLPDLHDAGHLTIHQWSTDWSNYFNAGKEWWGSFCWTLADPRNGWTTVILASATD